MKIRRFLRYYIADRIVFFLFPLLLSLLFWLFSVLRNHFLGDDPLWKYLILIFWAGYLFAVTVDLLLAFRKENKRLRILAAAADSVDTVEIDKGDPDLIRVLDYFSKYQKKLQDTEERHQQNLDFFSAWVHDIKTPLSVLRMLNDKTGDTKILGEINRIEEKLERGLFFIRSRNFSNDYLIESCNPDSILRELIKIHRTEFITNNIRVDVDGEFEEIASDRKWLTFIIDQLLQNSLRYTGTGGTISCRQLADADCTILRIRDSGIGIPAEDLPRIFDHGFTGTNGRRFPGTTGLGLYLASQVSIKLGHRLEIHSVPGSGTTADIIFPYSMIDRHLDSDIHE